MQMDNLFLLIFKIKTLIIVKLIQIQHYQTKQGKYGPDRLVGADKPVAPWIPELGFIRNHQFFHTVPIWI